MIRLVVLLEPAIDRDGVIAALKVAGVESTIGTYALSSQTRYAPASGRFPRSSAAFERSLTLPLHPRLAADDVETVVLALRRALQA